MVVIRQESSPGEGEGEGDRRSTTWNVLLAGVSEKAGGMAGSHVLKGWE